ncbi:hypothetical protein HDU76_011053, partial [Blyttiomyces sp. JEL0837]
MARYVFVANGLHLLGASWTVMHLWLIVVAMSTPLVNSQAIPQSKYRTNITLALFQPYSVGDLCTEILIMDKETEIAVNETNEDPNILPHTYVTLKRFNNFDPDTSSENTFVDSGGYAAVRAIEVVQSGAIIAAGEYYSKTT